MISKKHAFFFLLEHAPIVKVFLRTAGAIVPEYLQNERAIILDFGYSLPKSIDGWIIDDVSISATMSFNNEPFRVNVPWKCIDQIGVQGECTFVWVPDELADGADIRAKPAADKPARNGLRSV